MSLPEAPTSKAECHVPRHPQCHAPLGFTRPPREIRPRNRRHPARCARRAQAPAREAGVSLHRRQRVDEGPPRRQGREPRRDDVAGIAGAAGLHRHHARLQRLPRRRRLPARAVGRHPGGAGEDRARRRPEIRRPRQSAAAVVPLGRAVLDARDDGHGAEPRAQRRRREGTRRAARQRPPLRLGRLPAPGPDVLDRRPRAARRAVRGGAGAPPCRSPASPTTPTSPPRRWKRSPPSSRRW